ncbi:hypothetical protein [Paenibacillus dakarensis]|uniref:hypothetical protein n=1 Tax=Paenibacillus dakarensis TaxID=1527293 RepID=UPI0006D58AE2|nr:hypothetical protein [Paenibacillus dakarensis]
MNTIQICYDLKDGSEEQYNKLIMGMHTLGKAEHVQYSVWVVQTNMTDIQVRDRLSIYLKHNDSLFITVISSFASINVPAKATNLITNTWNQPKLVINRSIPNPPPRNRAINPLRKTY